MSIIFRIAREIEVMQNEAKLLQQQMSSVKGDVMKVSILIFIKIIKQLAKKADTFKSFDFILKYDMH